MLAVPSQMFSDLSGKSGTVVVRSTPQGHVITPHTRPSNPRTPAQTTTRGAFTNASEGWRGLTDAQRAGWTTLGKQMMTTNRIGVSRPMTGPQAHVALNGVLAQVGAAPIADAPAQKEALAPLPVITLEADRAHDANGAFTLMLRSGAYLSRVLVLATPPVSAGVEHPGDSEYRILEPLDGLINGGTSLTNAYIAKYGSPGVGSRIFTRIVAVSPNGFKGAVAAASTQVAVAAA